MLIGVALTTPVADTLPPTDRYRIRKGRSSSPAALEDWVASCPDIPLAERGIRHLLLTAGGAEPVAELRTNHHLERG
ncbi:hypothetical protein ABZV91_31170 [Nocardia sp. NPDC004568]|uniref:hypothetical protein n=1 Tax=Nocardia sp. NPDC004568 TaxID=3154551 RepID=UPI0033BB3716